MAKYRKKPVIVEAMQWDGSVRSLADIAEWAGDSEDFEEPWIDWLMQDGEPIDVLVHTLEGEMHVNPGEYVIRGVQGEFYPCKSDIFEATYEPVENGMLLGDERFSLEPAKRTY